MENKYLLSDIKIPGIEPAEDYKVLLEKERQGAISAEEIADLLRRPYTVTSSLQPNRETLEAIEEVQVLKNDPNTKTYGSFAEIVEDMEPELTEETVAAMREAERIACDPDIKRYSDVEEALEALKSMEYRGYIGSVEFSEADGVFFGSVRGIDGLVSYEGKTLEELEADFQEAVDDFVVATEAHAEYVAGGCKSSPVEELWKELGLDKVYTIIGGVHGVGKSSFLGALKGIDEDLGIIIDDAAAIEDCIAKGISFTQETTLSGRHIEQAVQMAKNAGYYIRLYYVGLDTVEECQRRIANRVARGGHSVAAAELERCFSERRSAVQKILPYCDEGAFYDNDNGFIQVATYRNGELILEGDYRPAWILELAMDSEEITAKLQEAEEEAEMTDKRYSPEEVAEAVREELFYAQSNIQHLESIMRDIEDGKANFAEHELLWDKDCSTCIHALECVEIGGRQEGRGFGAACNPIFGEEPHYERKM